MTDPIVDETMRELMEGFNVGLTSFQATDPSGRDLGNYEAAQAESITDVVAGLVGKAGMPEDAAYGLYAQGGNGAVRLDPEKTVGDALGEHNLTEAPLVRVVLAPELQGN